MERVRSRVIVHGVVQGVFFRDTCRRTALDHGVAGWVRNLPDGTVEAVFEGPAAAVARMLDWAHRGPSGADVTRVQLHEEQPEALEGFEIRA
ncbi:MULTISPECIES: acylphosphatase [unclassified Streptomyces]|uniref:acylphosphatase n=1 Tax=unclassified Streptomyces TaxID=2593676 RepID=UPI0022590219|nr:MULTISPECIES: acylphosphatase [unclassified Streptomyces]MCX4626475.1 acylphosphatase [Streptomyces sp. NBC_01443]